MREAVALQQAAVAAAGREVQQLEEEVERKLPAAVKTAEVRGWRGGEGEGGTWPVGQAERGEWEGGGGGGDREGRG